MFRGRRRSLVKRFKIKQPSRKMLIVVLLTLLESTRTCGWYEYPEFAAVLAIAFHCSSNANGLLVFF